MEVFVKENCKGTEDGFTVRQFTKGKVYDMSEGCAKELIRQKHAFITDNQVRREWKETAESGLALLVLNWERKRIERDFPHLIDEFNQFAAGL